MFSIQICQTSGSTQIKSFFEVLNYLQISKPPCTRIVYYIFLRTFTEKKVGDYFHYLVMWFLFSFLYSSYEMKMLFYILSLYFWCLEMLKSGRTNGHVQCFKAKMYKQTKNNTDNDILLSIKYRKKTPSQTKIRHRQSMPMNWNINNRQSLDWNRNIQMFWIDLHAEDVVKMLLILSEPPVSIETKPSNQTVTKSPQED